LSPILVRPVREQLEHDRVIRQLQRDLSKRKVEVGINPGAEQNVALGTPARKEYPDAVLFSTEKGRRVIGVVEVETGESVNNLEAMAQWAHYAKLRAPLHLYVPMGSVDVARRLASDNHIPVAEIYSYHQVGELMRFTLVYRSGNAPAATATVVVTAPPPKAKVPAAPKKEAARPAPKPVEKPAPSKAAPAKPVVKPAVAKAVVAKPIVAKPAAAKPVAAKPVAKVAVKAVKTAAPPKPAIRVATKPAVVKKPVARKAVAKKVPAKRK
jgi:hypothetical protein